MQMKSIRRISGYMFRYVYPLNKTAKKYLKTKSDYDWFQSYPKDDSLIWKDITDKKNSKEIPMPNFNLEIENIKYNKKRKQ